MNEKKDEVVEKSSPETSKNTPRTRKKQIQGYIFLLAAIIAILGGIISIGPTILHQIVPHTSITMPSPSPTPTIPTPVPTTPVTLGGKTVQGVVNDNNGNPVKGAIVEIDGLSAETGSDGYYVIRNVPINTKTITARAPGDVVVTRALKISEGDDEIIKFDIPLHSPATPKPTQTSTPRITASQALSPTITSSAPPQTTGSINVRSKPLGAGISFDGISIDAITPHMIPYVEPGKDHTIKLTLDEYRDWSDDNVLVKAGETTSVHATLTSIPSTTANLTLSSTATPPGASAECPEIKITKPKDGDTVSGDPVEVSGTAKNFTNDELSLWICVRSNDSWHIQKIHNKIDGEIWKNTNTWIGDFPEDSGKRYEVKVLVATKEADEKLKNRLNGCYIAKLPEGTKICDSITVVRG